jgi:hypothetical protein
MSGTPINLDTAPKQVWSGHPVTIRVTDIGKAPVHITTQTVLLHSKCAMTSVQGIHVTPMSATIAPGHTYTAHVTGIPASPGDYGVVTVAVAHGHGVAAAEAIGTQVISGHASSCVPSTTPHAALPAPQTAGLSMMWIWVPLAFIVVFLAIWGLFLRRRHHRLST